jgi:hypothetical protein
MDATWRSIGGMVGRMIDRAADFCKYASDTDYRGTVMEGPLSIDEMLFDGCTINKRLTPKKISWFVALGLAVHRLRPFTNH